MFSENVAYMKLMYMENKTKQLAILNPFFTSYKAQ